VGAGVITTTTRILQGVTYPANATLRNTAGAPGEKTLKTLTTGAQGIKTTLDAYISMQNETARQPLSIKSQFHH
jgi:hypothetical protein